MTKNYNLPSTQIMITFNQKYINRLIFNITFLKNLNLSARLLLVYFCLSFNTINAQTTIFSENFNSGGGNWTLNSSDLGSIPGAIDNRWVINNAYQGGFFGLIPNTPSQPAGITGAPQSGYLHITAALADVINNATFSAPANGNKFAKMTNGVSTIGFTNVSIGFWLLCNGDASATNSYFGRTYYSIDGGNTWIQNPITYSQISNWTQVNVTNPIFDNQADLRFAFMWVQNSANANTASDPAFSVDDFVISGSTSAINTITTGTITGSPFCVGSTFNVPFTSTGTFTAGNVYTAQLSNAAGSFATPLNIGTLSSTANSGNISVTIPGGTPNGSGYQIRIISSNPSTTGSSSLAFTINNTITPISVTPAGPLQICQGQSITLQAEAGFNSYVWSPGNSSGQTLTVNQAGSYSVTAQTAQGCQAASTPVQVTVSSDPLPLTVTPSGPLSLCEGQTVTLTADPNASNVIWSNGEFGNTLEIGLAGTYSATAQNASGCALASEVFTVTIGQTEPGEINVTPASPVEFCEGTSVVLTAAAGFSNYVWSNQTSGNTISVNQSGEYAVTALNSDGCLASSFPVIVNEINVPVASFTYEQTNGYNIQFTNTSTDGSEFLWTFTSGNTSTQANPSFDFPFDGDYPVTLVVTNACGTNTITFNVVVEKFESIAELEALNNIQIMPNPTSDLSTISGNSLKQEQYKVSLHNSIGQVIITERWSVAGTWQKSVDLNHLPKGIYWFTIESKSGSVTKRIVKI